MNAFLLSQMLAGISFLLDISAFHFQRRAITLTLLTGSTSLLAIHFYLLDQHAAAGLMIIAACRYATAIITFHRWVMWGYMLGSLLCSIYLWQNLSSILPLMGSLLMTFASFQKRSGKLRGYTLCGSLCWLLNNVIVGSPVAVIMTSIFRQYSGRLVASLRDQTLWMRINRRPARFAKTHQRQVTALGNFYRQRCRCRHSKQNLHAAHRRLLHHLVAGAAGD